MKITIIGAGKVGKALGTAFVRNGHEIQQVFSRNGTRARELATVTSAEAVTDLEQVRDDSQVYVLAVKDDAIQEVAQLLCNNLPTSPLVVHTSGATPSTVLADHSGRYGVFYPLQSFSDHRPVSVREIPICVDAAEPEDRELLLSLARSISNRTYHISDRERTVLHVAAVFVNNFTNHLYRIGAEILEKEGLEFAMLHPLIEETAAKIQDLEPARSQTGPAIRDDRSTIARHLNYLADFPEFRALYQQLTTNINPALIVNDRNQNQ